MIQNPIYIRALIQQTIWLYTIVQLCHDIETLTITCKLCADLHLTTCTLTSNILLQSPKSNTESQTF